MKIFQILTALFTLVTGLFCSQSCFAHSLYIFAQYDGQAITGKSYYSDMTPAAETYVEAFREGESSPAVSGKTDKKGLFHLPITGEANFKVVIEGEEGHRATVMADRISSSNTDNSALMLIREDINRLKDKIYLHDILGGIGYIFGIIGLLAWFKNYSNRKNKRENV
ncbi:hypothetical protein [Mannheimia massilioguelmaensis]|uniref:hypothetical protein n=1 Tax=Mannheimia massilioguelmaensis TaxID=1604354 RepID=UPI0005CB0B4F|nr:hypothetical protein [Mannheimia massilioguelmaensis]